MYYHLEILKQTRKNMLKVVESLSLEELNKTPFGFSNNIAWNFNHSILIMELLCYRLSGIEIQVPDELVLKFCKGSVSEEAVSQKEMDFFITLAKKSACKLEEHYDKGVFNEYQVYKTSYNVTLSCIEEAIAFNNVHESLHLGYIMALKRALK